MTTDPIAAARALIEPLTGYTPGPWTVADYEDGSGFVREPYQGYNGEVNLEDARLIAAAPDLRDMVATLADALEAERAKVAAAYEAAATEADQVVAIWEAVMAIRALTPADAQAALDKLLAEARLEGWRAGRDAAALCLEQGADDYSCGCAPTYCRCHYNIEQMRIDADVVRALPEPKEDSHD